MWPLSLFWVYVLPLYKWVLRFWTGKGELERIVSHGSHTTDMTKSVARYLVQSKQLAEYKEKSYDKKRKVDVWYLHSKYNNVEQAKQLAKDIAKKKRFNTNGIKNLEKSLEQMIRVNHTIAVLTKLRNEVFSYDNKEHVNMLEQQWSYMKPDTQREDRISDLWMQLGYQGRDPATDYRGMGVLGLHNLHYQAKHDTERARQMLEESHDETYWYSYAIAGINFTSELYDKIFFHKADERFYKADTDQDILNIFNEWYVKTFHQFHEFWVAEQATVMQFNEKKKQFFEKLK